MPNRWETTKTIGQCLTEYLKRYEGMDFSDILTDFIKSPEGGISAYSLYKTPERSETEFQDGSRQITEYYNLFARRPTQEDDVRIENNASLDEFSEWIEEKELEEDYPELPDGMTALEIGISDSASITSQEDTSAIYQVTIKLTYLKER